MNGKQVLVSGAGGFIGSHLTEHLLAQGYRVRALTHYHSHGRNGWLDHLSTQHPEQLEILSGDIRDPFWVQEVCQGQAILFHLAALIAIPFSYEAPASYLETNVQGSLHFLEAVKRNPSQRLLLMSTSEVYGTAQQVPISEAHPLQAQSPYSASKISMEAMARAYYHSFGTAVTVVRPFNNYGPRQSVRGVIPSIIRQLVGGTKSLELGDLRPTRDFLYVKDCVSALEQIARSPETIGQVLNIATGAEHSIGDLAAQLVLQIQPGTPIVQAAERMRPANSEVFRLCGDATLLQKLTSWRPQYKLAKGLAETIDWFSQPENIRLYPDRSYHH